MADPNARLPIPPALTDRSQPLAAVLCLQLPLPLIGPDCRARFDALFQFPLQTSNLIVNLEWPMLPARRSRPKPQVPRACATSSASANSTPGGPASISIGDIAGRSKIYIHGSRSISDARFRADATICGAAKNGSQGRLERFDREPREIGALPRCRAHWAGTEIDVRRDKAAFSSGCKPRPATAPAGSNRGRHGGDEMSEALG